MAVEIQVLEAGSEPEFPSDRVVGQVVGVYDVGGLVTAPGVDMEWEGLLSYVASATGRVALPSRGLFGFVELVEFVPTAAEGLHFIDGRAMGYSSELVISLEQIAADVIQGEEFAEYAEAILPRARTEYARVRSMGHIHEARRLLEFLSVVEPSFRRSLELIRLVLELDETGQEAVPMVSRLSRRYPDDENLRALKVDVLERRRRHVNEAEEEGHQVDASRARWDLQHLDPACQPPNLDS